MGIISLVLLVAALLVIKSLAPRLLGLPQDLILVQEDVEVAPFYENVFIRNETSEYLMSDPHTLIRATPLIPSYPHSGPNDLLGFRNLAVPNSADVIFIGDSQTYGNNAPFEHTIPAVSESALRESAETRIYSMATGGWGSLQYYYIAQKALSLNPEVLVVCFYTGNDPLESFTLAYGDERWREFRPDPTLSASDTPSIPLETAWGTVFADGTGTAFTPELRYISVQDNAVADAGWQIMRKVATAIAAMGEANDVRVVFTIIPTKELVYTLRLPVEQFEPPALYQQQVTAELQRIRSFESHLRTLQGTSYVPVWEMLQQAALDAEPLYPPSGDGHPLGRGYVLIANALLPTLRDLLGIDQS